ncbi:cobalt/nickel transport system permease protein [Caldalkalibacillus uzonensis]|uniref:Cobalt/nickel transport system permease protein n=1 Tax=Caldalkalibacillus uzonensis TaxID=353224 RepID=A0ABU0CUM7_9BACI|nr:cobalt transporter CbiM [Caldalkalibacillus uzonensis]MDQ0340119.1 cobalt/nickel transport system permease protein [Caldalkalibacillus uzonensis]
MHLSDGVLSIPVVIGTSIVAGGIVASSVKHVQQEDIPKISLMTAAFFVLSLINIPVGPSSVHPLLCGLLGIVLGRFSPIAVFISLLLQAILFQHGGLTTLGANTLLVALPALTCSVLFQQLKTRGMSYLSMIAGAVGFIGVLLAVLLLISVLMVTSSYYTEGTLSVVRLLLIGHIPLLIIETILTAFIVKFLAQVRPELIDRNHRFN